MKRRLLASLLTLVMMLSLLPTAVWARETGSGDPQETGDTAGPAPQSGEGETPREVELDLDEGSIVISENGYTQGENSGAAVDYVIKQSGSSATTNTITVTDGDHTIKLNGVNVDVSSVSTGVPCAFAIESGNVTLMLADGSENTLKSGWINVDDPNIGISYAGLWVQEQAQVVIDGGTGKLAAVGGGSGSSELGNTSLAAGIGASCAHASNKKDPWKSNVGTITIEGGVITAPALRLAPTAAQASAAAAITPISLSPVETLPPILAKQPPAAAPASAVLMGSPVRSTSSSRTTPW